jgi:hypothetical protein
MCAPRFSPTTFRGSNRTPFWSWRSEGKIHRRPDPNTAEYEALNTRAWVFQEVVLARRHLINSRKGVTWSCISDHIGSNCFEPHTLNVLVEQISTSRGAFGHPDLRGTYGFPDFVLKKIWGRHTTRSAADMASFGGRIHSPGTDIFSR